MKTLIIGGHGFVGTNLAGLLANKGHSVSALSRRDGLDLMDRESVIRALERLRPEAIFNCAAHVGSVHYVMQHAATVAHDNLQMALNLYRAVSEVAPRAHVINPLSNCSYPGAADVHYEPDWWNGEVHHSVFAYGNAKRFIYVLARCYNAEHQVRTSNFLVPNTFGVGDHLDTKRTHAISGMIVRMIRARDAREPRFEVWGSGRPVREWGYIDDITEILSRALEMDADLLYPVNIAQNHGATIRESAEAIREAVGYDGELWFNTQYEDGAPRKVLDDRRFHELFPSFQFTDHRDAIRRTVAYYEEKLTSAEAAHTSLNR
jgi:GDP-L-fucose synthase